MNNKELSVYLAREIFKYGDEPKDLVQRLQFMGGTWPDAETNLGGLSEYALASCIAKLLTKHTDKEPTP